MCGIAGVHRRGKAPIPKLGRLADTLLLGIENRGRDATGLLGMLPNGKVHLHRETLPASRFIQRRKRLRNEVRTLLLHTRYATVGSPDDVRNAHPQINGRMAATHNGTIYNHRELFDAFGLKRHASVDSEIIPALISYAGWENAAEAIDLFDGGAAFAVVSEQHPDEVILARTEGYPLVYYVTEELVIWASTRKAIESAWAMTYGGQPRGGEWVELPEWTMVRVNGTLEVTTIRQPKPKPKPQYRPVPRKRRQARPTMLEQPRVKPLQLDAPVRSVVSFDGPEPWMREAVTELLRSYPDMSYEDAYDEVFGVLPPHPLDEVWDPEAQEWLSAAKAWRVA